MIRIILAAWVLAVGAGIGLLEADSARPCDGGAPTGRWPSGTRLALAPDRPTLVVFVEAGCPCSRASLAELARLLARAPGPVAVTVVVSGGPVHDGLKAAIARGVRVEPDATGALAARFGVVTSGHALMFDPDGRRIFGGGLTAARGHEGDSLGRAAVLARLNGDRGPMGEAPVFGCPIAETPGDEDGEGPR